MCKTRLPIGHAGLGASACISALLGLSTVLLQTQNINAQQCDTGLGSSIGLSVPAGTPVHIGDVINVTTVTVFNGPTTCEVTQGDMYLIKPDNTAQLAADEFHLNAGFNLPGGTPDAVACSGVAGGTCVAFNGTYTVVFADINKPLTFQTTKNGLTFNCNAAAVPKNIQFELAAVGVALPAGSGNASACNTRPLEVIFPCVSITKTCVNANTPIGQPILFEGLVTNSGDTPLFNIVVTDTPAADAPGIVFNANTTGGQPFPGLAGLAPGDSIRYSGQYTPAQPVCGPNTDTISVTAQDVTGLTISNLTPCINPTTGVSTGPRPAVTAICNVICPPLIEVDKQVACYTPNGCPPGPAGYADTATGVRAGANCPAFCYRIVVTNPALTPGGQPNTVPLVNITLADPSLDLVACNAALVGVTLQPGQSATACVAGPVTHCEPTFTNTVTAQGASAFATGQTVTDTDTATINTVPISVNCALELFSSFDMDGTPDDNHVTLPADQQNAPIQVTVVINNPSTVDLQVAITVPGLVPCIAEVPVTSVLVPAGQTVDTVVGCVLASCPDGLSLTVTVQGTAVTTGNTCIYNAQGVAITTAPSTCTAEVICQRPATCRVTGGGTLLPDETQESNCEEGIDITTIVDGPDCNGNEALKITHGGQLGAPYADESCGTVADFPQGNPCIRGQWQHVRHYQGKANPRSFVEVDNFHSNTPKGIFDSVKCACLPCCENEEAGGLIGSLCNPDDHKICGPQPRPAPANAIIFTGVGYLRTCAASNQKGKGTSEAVIFRVYIEDRSEPGGQHPKGGKKPGDIYCFQAWRIAGQYDSPANVVLRQTLATDSCDFIDNYVQGTLPDANVLGEPLINDCGALHTGNQQIHPSTSAICTDTQTEDPQ